MLVAPSPKLQDHTVGVWVEVSVKVIVWPMTGAVGVKLKAAWGAVIAWLTVIIMIDQENVEKYAQDNDVPFSNYASLTRSTEVQDLIQGELDRVNKKFARVEQIKKFFLLETQLTAEDEELTPTMKLKRKLVQTTYAEQIEAMYR